MTRGLWVLCLATCAQAQTGYLTYPTGVAPSGVTAADLNSDGNPDVVVANTGSNSLTILLNNGAGGFAALPPLILGQANSALATLAPITIAAGDLNGDHKIDLVVSGTTSFPTSQTAGLAVLLGNGDGTFQPPQPVSGCSQSTGIQVADLNGDGIPDLAVTCLTGGGLVPTGAYAAILTGNGDGTFAQGPGFDLGFTPWAVLTIGDFNGDGKPDVAIAVGQGLTVLLNDGKANFQGSSTAGEPWNFAPGIAASDFNGDGVLDLAVAGQSLASLTGPLPSPDGGIVAVLLGNGDGTFQTGSSLATIGFGQLAAMDLNGDGHIDLAEGLPALVFFAGRGDGTFESGYPFGGSGSTGYFALADFTGSGVLGFAGANDLAAPSAVQIAGNAVILPRAVWPSLTVANVSGAGFGLGPLAPGSIATAFGSNLATLSSTATGPPPLSLGGATISVTDLAGTADAADLFYVSPGQLNYLIPADSAPGLATVSIMANGNVTATGQIEIVSVAPAIFTVNSDYLVAATVVKVSQNGDQTFETIYQTGQNGNITALPIDLGAETDTVYLSLYGTGIRNLASLSAVSATIGRTFSAPVTYAGPEGNFEGLDQVNLQLPRTIASPTAYSTVLEITVDGQPSNQVTLLIQ